mgnify:CR=1 FL=1
MAGFEIIADISDRPARMLPTSSFTGAVGDLIELTAGSATWAACTSTSNYFSRKAIVMEATTSAANVLAIELTGNELVKAESANNGAAADNGDRMVLTDSNTVNNTGTDNTSQTAAFLQVRFAGAAADKRIVGYVIVGPGVDPDAT